MILGIFKWNINFCDASIIVLTWINFCLIIWNKLSLFSGCSTDGECMCGFQLQENFLKISSFVRIIFETPDVLYILYQIRCSSKG